MSRGGRGGGRGGRGGRPMLPWEDANLKLDGRPSQLFPEYEVPKAAPLNAEEDKQVKYFLLFRAQIHDGPLYTQARTWNADPSAPARTYGQEQINQRYGVRNKATTDPFTAIETWSQQFDKKERSLPQLDARPFNKEYFPAELHATLDGEDPSLIRRRPGAAGASGAGVTKNRKRKTLQLSKITHLQTAEELYAQAQTSTGGDGEAGGGEFVENTAKALELMQNLLDNDQDLDGMGISMEDGEDFDEGDVDEEFDDSDADDYNAEQYFDGGDDEEVEDGGDDEAAY